MAGASAARRASSTVSAASTAAWLSDATPHTRVGGGDITSAAVIPEGATLVLQAGKRTLSLRPDDLEHYKGERGRRGNKLPRGFQRVDALLVETPV